jgi:hypothetical protein
MPRTVIPAFDPQPGPAYNGQPEAQGWIDVAWNTVTNNGLALVVGFTAAIAAAIAAGILLTRAVRRFAAAEKRAEKLTGPVMFGGMVWSAEAVWELTGPKAADLPIGLRIAIFTVLEFMLFVAMLRTAESMKTNGHPGRSGKLAWGIAGLMALVGFIVGAFLDENIGVAVFRPVVPIVLTTLWWIGVIGEGDPNDTSSWNWTPRNLLIRMGALKPGQQDVKKIQRDHLIQRMTDLYYPIAFNVDGLNPTKVKKIKERLAKLTLDADDEIIREVQRRVARTSWTTAQLLPYTATNPSTTDADEPDDETDAPTTTRQETAPTTRQPKRVEVPPTRRIKAPSRAATSGDASGDDPATKAAWLVVTRGISNQKAADEIGGTSEPSVRRRVKTIREGIANGTIQPPATNTSDAPTNPSEPAVTGPIDEPKESVAAGVNGYHHTPEEN